MFFVWYDGEIFHMIISSPWIWKGYLPLYEVADSPFHIQDDFMCNSFQLYHTTKILQLSLIMQLHQKRGVKIRVWMWKDGSNWARFWIGGVYTLAWTRGPYWPDHTTWHMAAPAADPYICHCYYGGWGPPVWTQIPPRTGEGRGRGGRQYRSRFGMDTGGSPTKRWANVVLLLDRRRRRRSNIKTTLVYRYGYRRLWQSPLYSTV